MLETLRLPDLHNLGNMPRRALLVLLAVYALSGCVVNVQDPEPKSPAVTIITPSDEEYENMHPGDTEAYDARYAKDRSFEVGLFMGCNEGNLNPSDPDEFLDQAAESMLSDYGVELDRYEAEHGLALAAQDPGRYC